MLEMRQNVVSARFSPQEKRRMEPPMSSFRYANFVIRREEFVVFAEAAIAAS